MPKKAKYHFLCAKVCAKRLVLRMAGAVSASGLSVQAVSAQQTFTTLAAWIGWEASPSYVDKDGIMREPFALVPLGAASTAVAVGTGAFLIIKRVRH